MTEPDAWSEPWDEVASLGPYVAVLVSPERDDMRLLDVRTCIEVPWPETAH